jgi:Spy/CpxP family protein refolding chaperone
MSKPPSPVRAAVRRPTLAALLAGAAVALAAAWAPPALAMPGGPDGGHAQRGDAMHGGMAMPFAHPRMAGRLLDSIDATPEQRTQIRTLVEAARREMRAEREAGRGLREQAMALFVQPTVDARAAEALRQQMLARHDSASKRMTQLMLDISRVLSPEQRKQLAERMAQRRDMMERHQRERRQIERPHS